jgi:hypothetical protein
MSKTIILNSHKKSNLSSNINNAIYDINWGSILDEGEYNVTWKINTNDITDPNSTGYDIISTSSLLIYYSFNSGTISNNNVSNYATGKKVEDAIFLNNTTVQNEKLYLPSANAADGLQINREINTVDYTNLTISMWLNLNSDNYAGAFTFITGLFTLNATSADITRWFVRLSPFTGNMELGTDANLKTTSFKPVINNWYHVVIRLSNSNTGDLWINGAFFQNIDGAGYPNFRNESGGNCLGRNPSNSGRGIVGFMDEYRHYSRYITNDEITTLYDYGHS